MGILEALEGIEGVAAMFEFFGEAKDMRETKKRRDNAAAFAAWANGIAQIVQTPARFVLGMAALSSLRMIRS